MAGAGYDEDGKNLCRDGVDAADYDNDGYPDVFITTLPIKPIRSITIRRLSFNYATKLSGWANHAAQFRWGTHFIDGGQRRLRDIFCGPSHVLEP